MIRPGGGAPGPPECEAAGMGEGYDDLASDYAWLFGPEVTGPAARFGATSPGSGELLEQVARGLPPGAAVLDCACGIGADAVALARRGFAVTATDASAGMAGQARRRAARHGVTMTVVQARWQDLPRLAPGPFDLVCCLGNALGHAGGLPQVTAALAAMRAVLRPGGAVLVDSRNWELLHASRTRIVPAAQVREQDGVRCLPLYIWTFPEAFGEPCQAEIVLLFEHPGGAVSHRRHLLSFRPFRHAELAGAVAAAGLAARADSYRPDAPFYAIAASAV